ncbi:MAG: ClC family H(+)/Cl(-) exchange transporter [Propionibacteriaceae bacterium]|nr:ClC family H(+)/Cl(-) exchange transporter [Propionibacteriaceae bacterium]
MSTKDEARELAGRGRWRELTIVAQSAVIGVAVGVVVSGFRGVLETIEGAVQSVFTTIRGNVAYVPAWLGVVVVLGLAVGWLSRRWPMIAGSGIPQVVAVIKGYMSDNWMTTLIAKFVGGALAMLGGLSLGREGPCIQMGAAVADGLGQRLSRSPTRRIVLIAGGASAGMSAAFGAPLAGVIFVFEEIFRYLSPLTLVATTTAAVLADYVTLFLLGDDPVLDIPSAPSLPLTSYWVLLVLGLLLGALGALYNVLLLGIQTHYNAVMEGRGLRGSATPSERRSRWGALVKPLPILGLAVIVGLTFPTALGGGGVALEALMDNPGLTFLAVLLVVKFVFSIVSFSAGVPGGILFPLLTIGAIAGAAVGTLAIDGLGLDPATYNGFIVVAMAGCFAAIVRAPVTGIMLLTEMTGSFEHFLALTLVSLVAYLTAEALGSKPIYVSLLATLLRRERGRIGETGQRVLVETIVHLGAPGCGTAVRDLDLPPETLIISVDRDDMSFIPDGGTEVVAHDRLTLVTDRAHAGQLNDRLEELFSN